MRLTSNKAACGWVTPTKRRLLAGLLISGLVATQLNAQQGDLIPEAPSCSRCRVLGVDSTLLTLPADGSIAGVPFHVRKDGRGRYWVLQQDGGLPGLYRNDGSFQGLIGRRGSGPGEFARAVDVVFSPGDSSAVVDADNNRISILGPSLTHERVIATPSPVLEPIVRRWPDVIAVVSDASPDHVGFPIQEASLSGSVIAARRTYSATGGELRPLDAYRQRYHFATSGSGFWAASESAFDLYHFSEPGRSSPTARIKRRSDWMRRVPGTLGSPRIEPGAFVKGIIHDGTLLWVIVARPLVSWKEGWAKAPGGAVEVPAGAVDQTKMFGATIEVIDPVARRVVARAHFDELPVSVVGEREFAFYRQQGDRELIILRRFDLRR
ncbi:MAG: hypothetical protein ACT4P7_10090 [Gemmatimonadaceae bacterium]